MNKDVIYLLVSDIIGKTTCFNCLYCSFESLDSECLFKEKFPQKDADLFPEKYDISDSIRLIEKILSLKKCLHCKVCGVGFKKVCFFDSSYWECALIENLSMSHRNIVKRRRRRAWENVG